MTSLKELNLSRCMKVTDAGIKHLLSIPRLEKLHLSQTGVTSVGVKLLCALRNLSDLDLGGLPISDQALSSLQVGFDPFVCLVLVSISLCIIFHSALAFNT